MSNRIEKKPPLRDDRNYPLNCWWVAGTTAEVSRKPIGRWLLDTPIVLFRTEAGEAVALENRCLHRWAPLSNGFMEGDTIVCPYHGARFGTDGRCERYPTQDAVPDAARVRAFPVLEHGPFIWIWLGDEAARLMADTPPDLSFALDPSWTVLEGSYNVDANYMLFHENVLDLTHFNYLHKDSLQITTKVPPNYWAEGDAVFSKISYDLTGKTPEERAAAGVFDPAVTSEENVGAFVTPALHLGTRRMFAGSEDNVHTIMHINHFVTPVSPTTTQYWWHFCVYPQIPMEAMGHLRTMLETAFQEDSDMLASIQDMVEQDPRGREYVELSFKGDFGGLLARRALKRILAKEAA